MMCLSSFLFFMSFNLIIPELPAYLTSLGGGQYKGLIIGLFTLAAFISRPFSGRLADTVGRLPIMIVGTLVCVVLGFMYPLLGTVGGFLVLRFFHGFSTGFQPTGSTAYIADVVPFNRRGEAMGYHGVMGNLGMAAGPALGSLLALYLSMNIMFYVSSGIALLSLVVIAGIKETVENKKKFKWTDLAVWREPIYDPLVKPVVFTMVLTSFSFGLILTLIPDLTDHLGISNRGIFFTFFTISSIASRVFAGKASDYYGRVAILRVAVFIMSVGIGLVALATTPMMFYSGAILFGLGTGMNTPTLFAWTVDLGDPANKGRSIATVFMGLEAGIFFGAVVPAYIYDNDSSNFIWTFGLGAVLLLVAFIFLLLYRPKHIGR